MEETDEVPASEEPPIKKQKLSLSHYKDVAMGEEISGIESNLAQNTLKKQFPDLQGLQFTLLQAKTSTKITCTEVRWVQIVHCVSRHH